MKESTLTCLSLAAALALGASSVARAEETPASRAPAVRGEPAARADDVPLRDAARRRAHASATPGDSAKPLVAASLPTLSGVYAPAENAAAPPATIELDEGPSSSSSNTQPILARLTNGPRTLVLSDELFDDREPLELLSSVILPAARGVTIAQIQPEGAPAPTVTLTVRPTKIMRGSGLVAVGRF